ncbi:Biotin--[biotin carboxyl-carrier protein] ligase [Luteimicrobium xylanilyticum]|uniref:Biotin--[biotin carboxyl-carrier protein] ligase n=1 Tax=Luteimicrobium xylanilyticum TaxID=1133546 RepID=A0A5P9Q8K0_9MICO|nr:biotin--[acetyl-CoA-carboxylase] ligase [Luteimicrobium xylanilyticum]QFU97699.1 Biotin--[biotin carboxyl-carrier protein] ligase [Luteimicrobium xylanilyticum]
MTDAIARPALDADALASALLAPRGPLARLDVVATSGSTNADLVAAASRTPDAWPAPSLLVADHQTSGKGRAGRTWETPPRAALTSSLLVSPGVPGDRLPWLPLLAGLAVVRALRSVTGLRAVLKWPNDVLLPAADGVDVAGWGPYRKAVGILVEGLAGGRAVVGVGVNVTQTADELPVPSATSLALSGAATTDRATLLVAQVGELVRILDAWRGAAGDARAARQPDDGPDLASAVADVCVTVGSRVTVDLVDATGLEGDAYGLGAGGELLVRADDGTRHAVVAGDVRHVRTGGAATLGG